MLKNCCAFLPVLLAGAAAVLPALPHSAASATAEPSSGRFVIRTWTTDEGLPQGSVIAIQQSRSGYLWLGTLNGLVRFDGVRFTVFDEANTPGLISRRIVHLFEDSRTNLWVGTESDGVVMIRSSGEVVPFDFGRGGPGGKLTSACEDNSGAIWLSTADGQLGRFAGSGIELVSTHVRSVIADRSGQVWIGTGENVLALEIIPGATAAVVRHATPVTALEYLFAGESGGHWLLANGEATKWNGPAPGRRLGPHPWGSARIMTAAEDQEGNLIVGTTDGVFWYDEQGRATRISAHEGLSHNTVLSLAVDREGTLWVGTDGGGLNRVRPGTFEVLEGTRGFTIQSVCGDRRGGVWFATFGGNVGHWRNGELREYGRESGLTDLYVRSVFVDRDEQLWVGTTVEGLFTGRDGRFEQIPGTRFFGAITAITQDSQGRLWFGTQMGLVTREPDGRTWNTLFPESSSPSAVRAILVDDDGTAWIGTEQHGLKVLRNGEYSGFRKTDDGLPSDTVTALWKDGDGTLWIGTSAGLARLRNGQWTRYTTREGLASNGIGYLLGDEAGHLWIGSYAGLMRIPRESLDAVAAGTEQSLRCRVYGASDGLPTRECTQGSQPAAVTTRDGVAWFSTIKGLVSVRPGDLRVNTFQPPVVIESVRIEGVEAGAPGLNPVRINTVTVPAGKERLDIEFTSLNLGAADRTRFRYQMEGHETGWTEAGVDRIARYSNLPPGDYTFRVIAANEDGIWNETGASLGVIVQPPFWRTWWFTAAMILLATAVIVAIVHYLSTQKLQRELALLRHQEELERDRARIARDLHDQLGANLTQVALLGEMAESDKHLPEEVEDHARQISQTARETTKALDEIVWAVNPSNDTLEGLLTYVCKYAQEYMELAGLKYRLDAPADLPDTPIAPEVRHNVFLSAKEAINNIVKHAGASSASLKLRLDPGSFTIEILDDGRGPGEAAARVGRNGLRNMRKRMEDIGGSFAIEPAAGQGTVVRLAAPIRK